MEPGTIAAAHRWHFDDHQQQIVEKLSSLNLLVPLSGQITREHLLSADEPLYVPDEYRRLPSVAACVEAALVRTSGRLTGPAPRARRPPEESDGWVASRKSVSSIVNPQ